MDNHLLTSRIYTFNISSILVECRAYINTIDDFEVKSLGKTVVNGSDTSLSFHLFSLKEQLMEFLIRCENESANGKSALIDFLKKYAEQWADKLTKNMCWLEGELKKGSSLRGRQAQLEDQKIRYQRFHDHNYNIIILVRYRVMDLPLPSDLQYYLGLIGLSWIADGIQLETTQDGCKHVDINDNIKLTHPQIAILCHYSGKPITRNNAKEIAIKFKQTSGQRLESVYNELISPLVRTGQGKNKVKDIETILPLLTDKDKVLAEKELKEAIANNKK